MKYLKEDLVVPARGERPPMAMSGWVARYLRAFPHAGLLDILSPSAILVPAPRSSLRVPGGLWVPLRLATALTKEGLGAAVMPLLDRREPVAKASRSEPANRPTAQKHFETIDVVRTIVPGSDLVVIDDVVTRGATLLACASHLAEAYPEVRVRAFAAMRTRGLVPDIDAWVDPFLGSIVLDGEDARRGDS